MRRWFGLFLTLAILLSLLPGTALGAGEQTPAEDAPAVEIQPEVPAEVPPEPVVPEENIARMASGSATVSGTISLPNGASVLGDSYLYVNLYTPPVLGADGQVLTESTSVRGTRIFLSQGQSSCSYSLTGVEPGAYLLVVSPYLNSPDVLGGTCFFNADGTPAANDCVAVPLQVPAGGCTANATLPAAPRSISGTLTFDQPAAKETRIRIFSYDNTSRVSSHSASLTVPQGATSAAFSVGVGEGSYYIQFTNEDVGGYAFYGIHGDVTKDYQQQMVLSTLDGSVSGLRIDGSSLMGGSAESNQKQVKVTVNLPAALTEEREYEVALYNAEQGYRQHNIYMYLQPGDHTLEATLSIAEGQSFLVGYADVTDCSNSNPETTGARYAAQDGITGLASEATVFTGGVDTEITITEPPCYTVTGTLTRDSARLLTQAAFVLANPPAHEFTLLTAKPFVSGKIYCPEGLTQSTSFVVYPQRADGISTYEFPQGAVEIMVGPGNGQQDEEGHWFSTYSLNDPSFPVGTSYRLVCYSIDTHTPADTSWYYVNQNGALTKDIDSATVYTIDGSADIVDFTPFLWGSGSESYVLQSEHGISSTADSVTYTYTCPGASSLNVTFSARTDVDLTLNNDFTPAAELAGKTVEISGDTLTVVMPALDFGGTSRFGFAVEKVEAVGGSSTPQTGAAAVYTSSGSSENAILSDVNAGEPVRVSFVSPADEYTTYLATGALYDKDGMLLDIAQVPVTFSDGTCTASLDFEQYGQAVTLKIFLLQDGLYRPEMAARAFTQKP